MTLKVGSFPSSIAMTSSTSLPLQLLAMITSPGPFFLCVVVTVCVVDCVFSHTSVTEADASHWIPKTQSPSRPSTSTDSSITQGEAMNSPYPDLMFTGGHIGDHHNYDHAHSTELAVVPGLVVPSGRDGVTGSADHNTHYKLSPKHIYGEITDVPLTVNSSKGISESSNAGIELFRYLGKKVLPHPPVNVRNISTYEIEIQNISETGNTNGSAVTSESLGESERETQRTGEILHLSREIFRTINKKLYAKNRNNGEQTASTEEYVRMAQTNSETGDSIHTSTNLMPHLHDVTSVGSMAPRVPEHADSNAQVGDVSQAGDGIYVDGVAGVDQHLPDGYYEHNLQYSDTNSWDASDYIQYSDYSAYENHGDHNYDESNPLQSSDHDANYSHYLSGDPERWLEFEQAIPCEPEKCLCAVFQVHVDLLVGDYLSEGRAVSDEFNIQGDEGVADHIYYNDDLLHERSGNESRQSLGELDLELRGPGQERGHPQYEVLCNASYIVRSFVTIVQD
ncbi:hypothetical protein OTU49_015509, partial [Cherax quadricarinatus]